MGRNRPTMFVWLKIWFPFQLQSENEWHIYTNLIQLQHEWQGENEYQLCETAVVSNYHV